MNNFEFPPVGCRGVVKSFLCDLSRSDDDDDDDDDMIRASLNKVTKQKSKSNTPRVWDFVPSNQNSVTRIKCLK